MKTQVTINWAPKADYQDRNNVIKYINKAAIVNAVTEAQLALTEYDSERPDGSPDMMAKAQLFDEYQRLVALYNRVIAGEVDKVEEQEPEVEVKPEKGNTDELLSLLKVAIGDDNGATFLKNYEEDIKEAKRAAKKVRKGSAGTTGEKKAKSASNAEKKGESHGNRTDAQDRLDRYSKELAEKEALLTADKFVTKDDKKACVKRIASLHRKIARANRALGIAE